MPAVLESRKRPPLPVNLPGIKKILYLPVTGSTQDMARELAEAGEREGTAVIAGMQTGGKGQPGRTWKSGPGGLYMTLILRPGIHARQLAGLSLLAAKTVAETITSEYGIKTGIKPPNDVLAWNPRLKKFMKISGILTESSSFDSRPEWVLLGLGVNLENRLPKNLENAVSLRQLLAAPVSSSDFLQNFLGIFWRQYSRWETGAASKN